MMQCQLCHNRSDTGDRLYVPISKCLNVHITIIAHTVVLAARVCVLMSTPRIAAQHAPLSLIGSTLELKSFN
jgi:hypothetical protein